MQNESNQPSSSPSNTQNTEVVQIDQALSAKGAEQTKGEMSVATIARLMGVATATDLQVVEGKIDLLFSKVTAMTVRVEKIMNAINQAPTGSDLERIDVQIGSLKSMIRELVGGTAGGDKGADKKKAAANPKTAEVADAAGDQNKSELQAQTAEQQSGN